MLSRSMTKAMSAFVRPTNPTNHNAMNVSHNPSPGTVLAIRLAAIGNRLDRAAVDSREWADDPRAVRLIDRATDHCGAAERYISGDNQDAIMGAEKDIAAAEALLDRRETLLTCTADDETTTVWECRCLDCFEARRR